jgi:hypothetical protein
VKIDFMVNPEVLGEGKLPVGLGEIHKTSAFSTNHRSSSPNDGLRRQTALTARGFACADAASTPGEIASGG